MPSPRYDYSNPLCCLAPGNGNGALITDFMLDAMRTAGCLMHFNMLDIGTNARARGYCNGATDKDVQAITLGRIILQAPCRDDGGSAWQPPHVNTKTDAILHYPRHALPADLPHSPYADVTSLYTPDYALFCLARPHHIRFYGEECADPSGMMLAAAMAAEYVGQVEAGQQLQSAVLHVLHEKHLPYGLYRPSPVHHALDGTAFTRAVCACLANSQPRHTSTIDWHTAFNQHPIIAKLRMHHMSEFNR